MAKRGDLAVLRTASRVGVQGGDGYDSVRFVVAVVAAITRAGVVKAVRRLDAEEGVKPTPLERLGRAELVVLPAARFHVPEACRAILAGRAQESGYLDDYTSAVALLADLEPWHYADPEVLDEVRAWAQAEGVPAEAAPVQAEAAPEAAPEEGPRLWFVADRDELAEALAFVVKGVPTRPAIPALAGVLLGAATAEQGRVSIGAFDLEAARTVSVPAEVGEAGRVLVAGQQLYDIVRQLPKGAGEIDVMVRKGGAVVTVHCGAAEFTVEQLPLADYPQLPAMPTMVGHLDAKALAEGVGYVAGMAGVDLTLPILTGVNMVADEGVLRLEATDRKRMGLREVPWRGGAWQANVPAKWLADVVKTFARVGGQVAVAFQPGEYPGRAHVGLVCGDFAVQVWALEGEYPMIRRLLPEARAVKGEGLVGVAELTAAVTQVKPGLDKGEPVRLAFSRGQVVVETCAATVPVEGAYSYSGPAMTVGLNALYLLGGLKATGGKRVMFRLIDPRKPVQLLPLEAKGDVPVAGATQLLMPVRLGTGKAEWAPKITPPPAVQEPPVVPAMPATVGEPKAEATPVEVSPVSKGERAAKGGAPNKKKGTKKMGKKQAVRQGDAIAVQVAQAAADGDFDLAMARIAEGKKLGERPGLEGEPTWAEIQAYVVDAAAKAKADAAAKVAADVKAAAKAAPKGKAKAAPAPAGKALVLEHTVETGTRLLGTCPGDGTREVMGAGGQGWRFSGMVRPDGAWYVYNSKTDGADPQRIEAAAAALRKAGFVVTVRVAGPTVQPLVVKDAPVKKGKAGKAKAAPVKAAPVQVPAAKAEVTSVKVAESAEFELVMAAKAHEGTPSPLTQGRLLAAARAYVAKHTSAPKAEVVAVKPVSAPPARVAKTRPISAMPVVSGPVAPVQEQVAEVLSGVGRVFETPAGVALHSTKKLLRQALYATRVNGGVLAGVECKVQGTKGTALMVTATIADGVDVTQAWANIELVVQAVFEYVRTNV